MLCNNLKIAILLFPHVYSENIPCWTLEQIADQIYLDHDTNNDGSMDVFELEALLVDWGIVCKLI